ncbi:MAG: hypothetical protein ACP5JJ_15890 [Anaerolineae bacterium]
MTRTPLPTLTRTPKPSPTLVPLGTVVTSGTAEPSATALPAPSEEPSPAATATTVSGGGLAQASATPVSQSDELADTGLGWGLIIISGVGLAALLAGARRLRLAG